MMPPWDFIGSISPSTMPIQNQNTNYTALQQDCFVASNKTILADCFSANSTKWNPVIDCGLLGYSNMESLQAPYNQNFEPANVNGSVTSSRKKPYFLNAGNNALQTSDPFSAQQCRTSPPSPPLTPAEIKGILSSVFGDPYNCELSSNRFQVPETMQRASCAHEIADLELQLALDDVVTAYDNHSAVARRKSSSEDSDSSTSRCSLRKRPNSFDQFAEKDDAYWEKRRKNNRSAKKSRDVKRYREQLMQQKVVKLETENENLRKKLATLKEENVKLAATVRTDDKLSTSEGNS